MDQGALRILGRGELRQDYHDLEGRLFFRETHVPEMLRLGRCRGVGRRMAEMAMHLADEVLPAVSLAEIRAPVVSSVPGSGCLDA